MKKISLRGISEILSEKELKNVMGGSFSCSSSGCSGSCYMNGGWVGWCSTLVQYIKIEMGKVDNQKYLLKME